MDFLLGNPSPAAGLDTHRYNKRMKRGQVIFFIVLILALGGLYGLYTLLAPRVVRVSPADHSENVPVSAVIQVEFNHEIQTDPGRAYLDIQPPLAGTYQVQGNTLTFTPANPLDADASLKVKVNPGIKTKLGIPLLQSAGWSFSVKHPWLVYLLDYDGKTEIYQVDPQGLDTSQLIEHQESILDYSISSDGKSLIYTCRDGNDTLIVWYDLTRHAGTLLYTCRNDLCSQPQLSPDQKYLAFTRGSAPQDLNPDASQVMLTTLNGEQLVGAPIQAAGNKHSTRDPSWSSSGWLEYYDDTTAMYGFYQPNRGTRASYAHDTGEQGSWSPDGTIFYFPEIFLPEAGSRSLAKYSSQLVGFNPDTQAFSHLTGNDTTEDTLPVFSPDGKWVAFSRRYLTEAGWTPGRQFWLIRSDGNNPRPMTNQQDFSFSGYSWSPDSTKIAYLKFNTADYNLQREVWIMNISTGISQKIIINGYQLGWIP